MVMWLEWHKLKIDEHTYIIRSDRQITMMELLNWVKECGEDISHYK
jgi:hypothetical protein